MPKCCTRQGAEARTATKSVSLSGDVPSYQVWTSQPLLQEVRRDLRTFRKGDKDSAPNGPILMIQRVLRAWGLKGKAVQTLLMPNYGPDGVFGNETHAAVVAFQAENTETSGDPLAKDGIVGDKTMSALDPLIAPKDQPPPPPKPNPRDEQLTVFVDYVIFPDGWSDARLGRILHEANFVFNRAGINIVRGTVWQPSKAGPAAEWIFEKNRKHGRKGDACPSEIMASSLGEVVTPEIQRLSGFRPSRTNRITVYHVAPFPNGAATPWGAAFNLREFKIPYTVLIPKSGSADPVDITWHELGHCLLDTKVGEEVDGKMLDHSHDFMSTDPFPGLGKAALDIPEAVKLRLRQTARTLG